MLGQGGLVGDISASQVAFLEPWSRVGLAVLCFILGGCNAEVQKPKLTEEHISNRCRDVLIRYHQPTLISWLPDKGEAERQPCSKARCYEGNEGILAVADMNHPNQAHITAGPFRLMTPADATFRSSPFKGLVLGRSVALLEGPTPAEMTLFHTKTLEVIRVPRPQLMNDEKPKFLFSEGDRIWLVTKQLRPGEHYYNLGKHLLRDAPEMGDVPILKDDRVVGQLVRTGKWRYQPHEGDVVDMKTPLDVEMLHARQYGEYAFAGWNGHFTMEVIHGDNSFLLSTNNKIKLLPTIHGALLFHPEQGLYLVTSDQERKLLAPVLPDVDFAGTPFGEDQWRESINAAMHEDGVLIRERIRNARCELEDRIFFFNVKKRTLETVATGPLARAHMGYAVDQFRWVELIPEYEYIPFDD